jgi:hypothetical protein
MRSVVLLQLQGRSGPGKGKEGRLIRYRCCLSHLQAMEFLEKRSPGRLEQQSSKTSTSTPTPSTTLPSTSPSSSAPPTSAPPQAISSSPPTDYTPDERRYLLRLRLAGKSAYKRKWHAGVRSSTSRPFFLPSCSISIATD